MRTARALLVSLLALLPLAAAFADGPAPSAAPAGPSAEEREAVRRMVAELREEASRIRGLPWKSEVPADLLSRDQLYENIKALVHEDYPPEKQARDEKILRRIGLLEEGQDSVEMLLRALKELVAGYYDPKSDRLYIVEGETGDAQRPVMLHELIHALEDQHYDLEARMKPIEEDPDRTFAEKCLGEGSAEHARALYEKAYPEIARLHRLAEQDPEMARRQEEVLRQVPAFMILPEVLVYSYGPELVGRCCGEDYAGGMNRLYDSPPTTQEQWLHPEKWLGPQKDLPRSVAWAPELATAAGEGWKVLHDKPTGELDVNLYLAFFASGNARTKGGKSTVAEDAAHGWDAGRDLFLEKDGMPLIWVQALAFDGPRDAGEAAFALAGSIREHAEGTFRAAGDWTPSGPPEGPARLQLDYRTSNGRGRILVRGDEVLMVDGAPETRFESVWAAVERTTIR